MNEAVKEYTLLLCNDEDALHPVLMYKDRKVIPAMERVNVLIHALQELYRTERDVREAFQATGQQQPAYLYLTNK